MTSTLASMASTASSTGLIMRPETGRARAASMPPLPIPIPPFGGIPVANVDLTDGNSARPGTGGSGATIAAAHGSASSSWSQGEAARRSVTAQYVAAHEQELSGPQAGAGDPERGRRESLSDPLRTSINIASLTPRRHGQGEDKGGAGPANA